MERDQLQKYLHKKNKIILRNSFHFSGFVKDLNDKYLTLVDKHQERITIENIEICAVVEISDNPRVYEGRR